MRNLYYSATLAALALSVPALAQPVLVASVKLAPDATDLAPTNSGVLENGVPENLLSGLGSGLTWVNGDTFLALPDRGPNAKPYNTGVDNTTSYINRFQTFTMRLTPTSGGALPFSLSPNLTRTTLLYSPTPLVYSDGGAVGLPNGAPKLNSDGHYYFTGRSDNFDPASSSLSPENARLDPEGIRVASDGKSVFISDEYGPHIYQFDRETGQRLRAFALPEKFGVSHLSAQGESAEISDNMRGRVANKGMEGLAITPDGKTLVGIMQSALLQDGGTKAPYLRILTIDLTSGVTHEYAYQTSNIGTAEKPKFAGVSEIVAINDHEFLIDERDGTGMGDGTTAQFKQLFCIDLSGAYDVSDLEGAANLAPKAVTKTLFADLVLLLKDGGVDPSTIPGKIEGLDFGPDVSVAGQAEHTLWIASDNDFLPTVNDGDGKSVSNPNVFYVLAFSDADLPGYRDRVVDAK